MNKGKVYLVGAGPGDPGLLTLRGLELLSRADLVLYDGLVNSALLRFTNGVCERTARTRTGASRIVPQDEINQRLVSEAREGKCVVRLKGGDPFIFGRGSEEAAALEQAGIDYEVVPGVTAATAAGEYAGFSFTHRQIASAVAFVTGHEDPSRGRSHLDYQALAAFPGTLVFYMGLGRIATICQELIESGKPSTTPAAVICKASLPDQRVVTATLSSLPLKVANEGLVPPSLIVVGECVELRQLGSWFERRPLMGKRVGITRADHQCDATAERIVENSGQPVLMPMISISDIDPNQVAKVEEQLSRIDDYDWLVFTSPNAVDRFFRFLLSSGRDVRALGQTRVAAIGPSVSDELSKYGLVADVLPDVFRAESLAECMADKVNGKKVLWPRADRARDVLPRSLRASGAEVVELVVYHNVDNHDWSTEICAQLTEGNLDWVGLSSPSIARQFAEGLQRLEVPFEKRPKIVAISPVTAAAARDAGLDVVGEATFHTWDGIVDKIIELEQQTQ